MVKNEDFHKNVGLFVRNYTLYPEKLKIEREQLKDKLFAWKYKVSVTTVRNYMGKPPNPTQEKRLSIEEISKINTRRKNGEPDVKIALENKMSASTLCRYCGSRKSIGLTNKIKRRAIEFHIPPMVIKKVIYTDPNIVLTEKQRLYEESWKAECIDTCGSIDISAYKR